MNVVEELNLLGFKNCADPWDAVLNFEDLLSKYAGSKYSIVVDSCSNALFLCLKYLKITNQVITIPSRTYSSVPMQIIHSGNNIRFDDITWHGYYTLGNTPIIDAATIFCSNMYKHNSYMCTSFHHRKTLKLGRGGCIFTDDENFIKWCRPMIYDGRNINSTYAQDEFSCIGYHMYMTPEDAVRGIKLLKNIPNQNPVTGSSHTYKDISKYSIFQEYLK